MFFPSILYWFQENLSCIPFIVLAVFSLKNGLGYQIEDPTLTTIVELHFSRACFLLREVKNFSVYFLWFENI